MLNRCTHRPAAEAEWRLKAKHFKSVELVEVPGSIRAVVHSSTLRQPESKKPSHEEDGFQTG
jgi:hypothetical protein